MRARETPNLSNRGEAPHLFSLNGREVRNLREVSVSFFFSALSHRAHFASRSTISSASARYPIAPADFDSYSSTDSP
jgi:hypothetical protein